MFISGRYILDCDPPAAIAAGGITSEAPGGGTGIYLPRKTLLPVCESTPVLVELST